MALFDWIIDRFNKNQKRDIPKEIFTAEPNQNDLSSYSEKIPYEYDLTSNLLGITYNGQQLQGIDSVHLFITLDQEKKGYKDAIVNPDSSNLQDNLKKLYYDLTIVIERALSFYEEKIKMQDYHIRTKKDFGLHQLADEIEAEKQKIQELIDKIKKIETDAIENTGKSQRLLLSYEIGFKRGLAALAAAKLFLNNNDTSATTYD